MAAMSSVMRPRALNAGALAQSSFKTSAIRPVTSPAFQRSHMAQKRHIVRYQPDTQETDVEQRSVNQNKASTKELERPTSLPRADRINVSPEIAERRADLGKDASLGQLQAFDGPAPETINGRLCMLAVPIALWWEARTGQDIAQQCGDHPWAILAVFLIITGASYAPILRGYTRKEPFANTFAGLNWTPKAENWNGRLAMLGFTGMILTEAGWGGPTWQAWFERFLPHIF